ncbi:prolyl oligopeptidase family serine peptidase [Nocardioides sp. GY 10127]|uniref:prolyl oligopeptidase family serine peptidase n=1 Tax=Nocardioides sp. GY 10127 TaxID=2569762 RepID=UPI001458F229|nr:prolyl oligopeptidase family serine peptidase [Nocardioides sp. GY 10127]
MTTPQPPTAPREPHEHVEHGTVRPDAYHWMSGRGDAADPRFLDYLRAERAFHDDAVGHLVPLSSSLLAEMVARLPETDTTAPWRRSGSWYYSRVLPGSDYPQLVRRIHAIETGSKQDSVEHHRIDDGIRLGPNVNPEMAPEMAPEVGSADGAAPEEVVLDVAALAEGVDYLELGVTLVSPDERLLAYSVDTDGDEVYELRFRDLTTGEDLDEVVPRSYYGGAWSADSRWFFYTVHDDAYRPHQVWRHRLGTPVDEDVLVLTEPDQRFELHLRASRSGRAVLVLAESRDTGESWFLDAEDPTAPPRSIGGRRRGVVYRAEHVPDGTPHGHLLVVTDDDAPELRLVRAPVPPATGQDHTSWTLARPEDPSERLERVDAFAGHLVLSLRSEQGHVLRVLAAEGPHADLTAPGTLLTSAFDGGYLRLGRNPWFDEPAPLVVDQSRTQPPVASRVSLASGDLTEVHREAAPGHDPQDYVTERRTFTGNDGVPVPATLVRHRDTPLDGSAPCHLWAYGAYEYTFEAEWDASLPALLDRGVVHVHAHVRGGGEGGRRWWQDGHLAHKQHTFDDLLTVADGLAGDLPGTTPLVDGARLATRGLSAGGLLQGAVLSRRPERWRAVVAEVPFVDVVTTMLDASIPLTVNEWDEWGDPHLPDQHAWMLAYSPYDNLPPAGHRPDLLVTGALHDPRVMVHEPAKWVAALRHTDPAWSPRCLFRVEVGAGSHAGPSGREGALAYEADVHAWVLDRLGVTA